MKSIILISTLAMVYCMPSNLKPLGNNEPSVEIEKQLVVELTTSSTRVPQTPKKPDEIDETTREILAKIEQVNKKQGYVGKSFETKKPSEVPHYYSFSHQQPKPLAKYVYEAPQTGNSGSKQLQEDNHSHHHPTRKISQQQTYLIPVASFAPQLIVAPIVELPKFYNNPLVQYSNDIREELERKTVDNVKDIVVSSQLPPNILSETYFNPLVQNLPYYTSPFYGYGKDYYQVVPNSPGIMLNSVTTVEEYDPISCTSEKGFGKDLKPEITGEEDDEIEVHLDNVIISNRTEKEIQEKSKPRPPKPILVYHNNDQYMKPQLDDEVDSEKDKAVETNDRKFLSKDNIGDGIFIRRLKVRKGGVAIAGPGGIATAGSGGTAIVGPNGYAYTHPDSLAIAGSGTKVIAVDPNIKLGDLIKPNITRKGILNTRVGKVVAVGPVIYYNRG